MIEKNARREKKEKERKKNLAKTFTAPAKCFHVVSSRLKHAAMLLKPLLLTTEQ